MSYMLINNNSYNSVVAIDRFCSYLMQASATATNYTNASNDGDCKPGLYIIFTRFSREDGYTR